MNEKNNIHTFAVKWVERFKDSYMSDNDLIEFDMSKDCEELGFIMDGGESFASAYGNALNDINLLDKIIDDVSDENLLGSLIYSKWDSITYKEANISNIIDKENCTWFIIALARLALLTGDNPFIFSGVPTEMRLVSDNMSNHKYPRIYDEKQVLTINENGKVSVTIYEFEDEFEEDGDFSNEFKLKKSITKEILNKVASYFSEDYEETLDSKGETWLLEITNSEGQTFKFRGVLSEDLFVDGIELSSLIRERLNMSNLYVFNANNYNKIDKITLDYNRTSKFKTRDIKEYSNLDYIILNQSEKLIIDRKTETLEYVHNFGTGCKVTRKYEIEDGICSLLDDIAVNNTFDNIAGDPDNVIEDLNDALDYVFTIDYVTEPQKIIRGTFDKNNLPSCYDEFIDEVLDFMSFYGMGNIFNPSVYERTKRVATDLIFCSVVFDDSSKSYYYLTEDDSIEVNDYVDVPVGDDNDIEVARVVNIEYYDKSKTPFPLDLIKSIIAKHKD